MAQKTKHSFIKLTERNEAKQQSKEMIKKCRHKYTILKEGEGRKEKTKVRKKNNEKPYNGALMWNHMYLCSNVKTSTITLSGDPSAHHNQNKETKATISHGIQNEPHKSIPTHRRTAMNLQLLQEVSERALGCGS